MPLYILKEGIKMNIKKIATGILTTTMICGTLMIGVSAKQFSQTKTGGASGGGTSMSYRVTSTFDDSGVKRWIIDSPSITSYGNAGRASAGKKGSPTTSRTGNVYTAKQKYYGSVTSANSVTGSKETTFTWKFNDVTKKFE